MQVFYTKHAGEDYDFWKANDLKIHDKIAKLIDDIKKHPFTGLGKPEPLQGNLAGYWSRRITGEHRLVYRVSGKHPNQTLTIIQAKFHY